MEHAYNLVRAHTEQTSGVWLIVMVNNTTRDSYEKTLRYNSSLTALPHRASPVMRALAMMRMRCRT